MFSGSITIPEYYARFINKDVDLNEDPKQRCPLHNEKTESWSYDKRRQRWRCFGSCKIGGDVYELHRANYKLATRREAIESLDSILGRGKKDRRKLELHQIWAERKGRVDEYKAENMAFYVSALELADCPEKWLELDLIMSKTPIDYYEIMDFVSRHGGKEGELLNGDLD